MRNLWHSSPMKHNNYLLLMLRPPNIHKFIAKSKFLLISPRNSINPIRWEKTKLHRNKTQIHAWPISPSFGSLRIDLLMRLFMFIGHTFTNSTFSSFIIYFSFVLSIKDNDGKYPLSVHSFESVFLIQPPNTTRKQHKKESNRANVIQNRFSHTNSPDIWWWRVYYSTKRVETSMQTYCRSLFTM